MFSALFYSESTEFTWAEDPALPQRTAPSSGAGHRPEPVVIPAYVPALHTSFPPLVCAIGCASGQGIHFPAPLPPAPRTMASTPSPPPPPPPPPPGPEAELRDPRSTDRLRTSTLPSVTLTALGSRPVYATLRDISRHGAGVARRGRLDVPVGTSVRLEIHSSGSEQRYLLAAQVRWSRFAGVNTYLGLHFDSPLPSHHPLLAMGAGPDGATPGS